ncbi:DUF4266 domain-containing protein [Oxalobacteraceae bacterium OM1]|nr:DUF4266 domain-containing protein [Oxalobacteraceae bacterium OM1]
MPSFCATCLSRIAGAGLLAASAACAPLEPVQPWQKGTLAKPEMTIEGNDVLGAKASDHAYVSREGASGGSDVGGGGCGCN